MTVNNEKILRIDGLKAKNFYILLKNCLRPVFTGKFCFSEKINQKSKAEKNNNLGKDFEEINVQMSENFYEYGLIYGAIEFIEKNGYYFRINSEFKDLIRIVN